MVQGDNWWKKTKAFSSRLPILTYTRSAVIKDMRDFTDSFLVPAGWRVYVRKATPEMTTSAQKTQFNWRGRTAIILSLYAASHNHREDNSIQIFAFPGTHAMQWPEYHLIKGLKWTVKIFCLRKTLLPWVHAQSVSHIWSFATERVTGRKARGLQIEEIACKCQTFLSLLSGRRKQTSNIFSFSIQI